MSNIWCNRCHKLLATPWCPNCDNTGKLARQSLDEGYQAVEVALGPEGVRALVEAWNTAQARVRELEGRIRRCEDCDATMNHIGNGIFECWKCTEAETRAQLVEANRQLADPDYMYSSGRIRRDAILIRNQHIDEARLESTRLRKNIAGIIAALDEQSRLAAMAATPDDTQAAINEADRIADLLRAALAPKENK